jgi:uncharacterized protein (DUF849 family)
MPTAVTAIAVAPNGGRRTKADHPAIPITVDELARDAAACLEEGAAMVHAHIRDAEGKHLLDAEAYRHAIGAIRKWVGERLVIQITSESVGRYDPTAQIAVVKAVRPEAVSLGLRELVPDAGHERSFADFLGWLRQEHITPQIILYSVEDAQRLAGLSARGLIPWPNVPVLFVLGSYQSPRSSEPADLDPFLAPGMPRFEHWMACAFGRNEAACLGAAARAGGHVRVGFENNLHQPDGTQAPNNAAQVRTVAECIREAGCRLQDADALRAAWAKL